MQDSEIIRMKEQLHMSWPDIAQQAGSTIAQVVHQYRRSTGYYKSMKAKRKSEIEIPLGTGKYDYIINEELNEGKDYKELLKTADFATRRCAKFHQSRSSSGVS